MQSRGEVHLASMDLGATSRDEFPLSSSMRVAGAERAARHRAVCEKRGYFCTTISGTGDTRVPLFLKGTRKGLALRRGRGDCSTDTTVFTDVMRCRLQYIIL